MAGFRIEYDTTQPVGERVVALCALDDKKFKAVENEKEYWVGISDFLSGGGDGYDMIRDERLFYQKGRDDASVFVEEIKARTPITSENSGKVFSMSDLLRKLVGTEARIILNGKALDHGNEVEMHLECTKVDSSSVLATIPSLLLITILTLIL